MNKIIKARLTSEETTTVIDLIESEITGTAKRLEYYKKQGDGEYIDLASRKLNKLQIIINKLRGESFEK